MVLQGYGLVAALTARENVAVVLQAAGVPRAQVRSRVQAVLEGVKLAPVADHLVAHNAEQRAWSVSCSGLPVPAGTEERPQAARAAGGPPVKGR